MIEVHRGAATEISTDGNGPQKVQRIGLGLQEAHDQCSGVDSAGLPTVVNLDRARLEKRPRSVGLRGDRVSIIRFCARSSRLVRGLMGRGGSGGLGSLFG